MQIQALLERPEFIGQVAALIHDQWPSGLYENNGFARLIVKWACSFSSFPKGR